MPNSLETAVRIHSFEYWLWSLNYRTWVQISDPTTKNFNHHSYQALNQTIASEIHQLNCKLRQIKIIAVYFRKTGNERNESKIEFSSMLENFIPSAVYLFPPPHLAQNHATKLPSLLSLVQLSSLSSLPLAFSPRTDNPQSFYRVGQLLYWWLQ